MDYGGVSMTAYNHKFASPCWLCHGARFITPKSATRHRLCPACNGDGCDTLTPVKPPKRTLPPGQIDIKTSIDKMFKTHVVPDRLMQAVLKGMMKR
jgi:hypothetical protein